MSRFFVIILLINPCYAQLPKGPGGVGSNDGTTSLVLWLNANTVSAVNGATVTTWSDMSGYGNHFTSGNGAVFNTAVTNGYPAFTFNGTSNYFETSAYNAVITPLDFNVFTANKVTASTDYKTVISNRDEPVVNERRGFMLYAPPTAGTANKWECWTGDASGSAWDMLLSGVSTAGSWAGQSFSYANATNEKKISIKNAAAVQTSVAIVQNLTRNCRVGSGYNELSPPQYYFKGNIGEIIMYNVVVNSAQKNIIENYLAAKYNYALTANDIYTMDNAGNGDFDHDVAGIGRIDVSNSHSDAQGTGMVRILNPSGLGDGEYFIWGHNNLSAKATNTTDVPVGVQGRFARIWRSSEVGDVGNLDIHFDLTGNSPITTSDLRLLIDTDDDGVFSDETAISGASSLGSNIYAFTGVAAFANQKRFTLGTINKSQTPLPIELVYFNVFKNDNETNQISWATASETNNDYFEVEKSTDGMSFITLEQVNSMSPNGCSYSKLNYSSIDDNPINGINYYRLKQLDKDKRYTYSNIVALDNTHKETISFKIYPNPNEGLFDIDITGIENNHEVDITIVDNQGKLVTEFKTDINSIKQKSFQINVKSILAKGTYTVLFVVEDIKYTSRLIIY